jgi:hypothetical protein
MSARANIFVLGLLLLVVAGCSDHRAWNSVDSWHHPPADIARFWQAGKLPAADILEVRAERMAEAEAQLREAGCVEVSAERASELSGKKVESAAGRDLFLVRGVCLNRATGGFVVVPLGRELLVHHASLGRSAVPMKRQPLIVRLAQKPEIVFVSCSMAE